MNISSYQVLYHGGSFVLVVFLIYRAIHFFLTVRNGVLLAAMVLAGAFLVTNIPLVIVDNIQWLPVYKMAAFAGLCALSLYPEISGIYHARKRSRPLKVFTAKQGPLDEIVKSCELLAQSRTGALMAIQRSDDLTPFVEKSVVIDAKVRHELLLTIFTPPTYLHDGGIIISEDRVTACAAIFPLTQNTNMKKDLGTRHRAALGMSEETDALCVVVSEESGSISLADRGRLYYNVPLKDLKDSIQKLMKYKKMGGGI